MLCISLKATEEGDVCNSHTSEIAFQAGKQKQMNMNNTWPRLGQVETYGDRLVNPTQLPIGFIHPINVFKVN
jgi:hypothetical protein